VGKCEEDVPDGGTGEGVGFGMELVKDLTALHGSLARLYYSMRRGTPKEARKLFLKISRFL
jgi:hypothetical protein